MSWKTTLAGIAAILIAVGDAINSLVSGTPVNVAGVLAAIAAGVGLMKARDNKVTSEDVGAK